MDMGQEPVSMCPPARAAGSTAGSGAAKAALAAARVAETASATAVATASRAATAAADWVALVAAGWVAAAAAGTAGSAGAGAAAGGPAVDGGRAVDGPVAAGRTCQGNTAGPGGRKFVGTVDRKRAGGARRGVGDAGRLHGRARGSHRVGAASSLMSFPTAASLGEVMPPPAPPRGIEPRSLPARSPAGMPSRRLSMCRWRATCG